MAAPPPSTATTSHLLSTHRALVDTLTSFLTVCTHHILYLRHVYPPRSFLSTRAYNYPVRQNRHPAVCAWINDAIAAIRDQLAKNTIANISLCIYECESNRVLERWTFDLHSFPSVAKRDRDVPFSTTDGNYDEALAAKVNLVDLEATFRATLSRITTSSNRLKPLPEPPHGPECSFTLTIELAATADRPVGRLENEERKWIAAEPDSFSTTTTTNGNNQTPSHPLNPHQARPEYPHQRQNPPNPSPLHWPSPSRTIRRRVRREVHVPHAQRTHASCACRRDELRRWHGEV